MTKPTDPPDMQECDFMFDGKRLRGIPGAQEDPRLLLDALCEMNPAVPRRICAVMGAQCMRASARPMPGHEQEFLDVIAWLEAQGGGMKVIDQTQGHTWSDHVRQGDEEWKQ